MKAYLLVLLCLLASLALAASRYQTFCFEPTGEGEASGEGTFPGEGEGLNGATGEGEAIYVPDIFRVGEIDIDSAFEYAFATRDPLGLGCGHLATWDSQAELDAILESMYQVGSLYSTVGLRLNGGFFEWAVGRRTGQQVIDARGAPYVCVQDFCIYIDAELLLQYSEDQVGMNLVLYRYAGEYVVQLAPATGANCYTVEFPGFLDIPSINGAPPVTLWPVPLTWFDIEEAMINDHGYLARIQTAEQNEAIRQHFTCGRFYIWLGYYARNDVLRLGAGPDSGKIIMHSRDRQCDEGYFCNFNGPQDFEEDEAVAMNSQTGYWELRNPRARVLGFIEREVCPQANGGQTFICQIVQGVGIYKDTVASDEANRLIDSGNAILPGGPFRLVIDEESYVMYFDCDCQTDSRVNTACLISGNLEECAVAHLPGDLQSNDDSSQSDSEDSSEDDIRR